LAVTLENLEVSLTPHKGVNVHGVEEYLNQFRIWVNGTAVGYVGDHPGAHINVIYDWYPAEILTEIKKRVDQLKGDVSSQLSVVKDLESSEKVAEKAKKSKKSDIESVGL